MSKTPYKEGDVITQSVWGEKDQVWTAVEIVPAPKAGRVWVCFEQSTTFVPGYYRAKKCEAGAVAEIKVFTSPPLSFFVGSFDETYERVSVKPWSEDDDA